MGRQVLFPSHYNHHNNPSLVLWGFLLGVNNNNRTKQSACMHAMQSKGWMVKYIGVRNLRGRRNICMSSGFLPVDRKLTWLTPLHKLWSTRDRRQSLSKRPIAQQNPINSLHSVQIEFNNIKKVKKSKYG